MADIGIDKVVLTTQDFRHTKKDGWTYQPPAVKFSLDDNQEPIQEPQGQGKWFLNHDNFNATIGEKGLLVSLNPSKPYHPYRLCSDQETLRERTETALNSLIDLGVSVSTNEMKVSRIDISRNELMKQPFADYLPALSLLGMAREKRQATYPEGRMIANNQRGLIIYDKTAEVRLRPDKISVPDNLARAELQVKTTKSVGSQLQFYKFENFSLSDCQDYFRKVMKNEIFKAQGNDAPQLAIPFDKKIELISQHTPHYIKKMFGAIGLITFYGSIDLYLDHLKAVGKDRMAISREKKYLHKALADHSRIVGTNVLANNYTELKHKFCA
jgi:hypothetical protein